MYVARQLSQVNYSEDLGGNTVKKTADSVAITSGVKYSVAFLCV